MKTAALALFAVLIFITGCEPADDPTTEPEAIYHPEWSAIFDSHEARGTFVLLDAETGIRHTYNPERADIRYTPASTFKVYNSLVALETGVVPNVDTMYAWNGTETWNPNWNQDHSLRMGVRNSAVWLFQELAEQIGKARYEEAFAREPYGNSLVGDSLRMFWLETPLAISPNEQVAILDRLRKGELTFRPEVQASVREIMLLEEEAEYTLYGKTGWAIPESGDIGWIVGWIERDDNAWVFALNTEANGPGFDMMSARRSILNDVLVERGLRPTSD